MEATEDASATISYTLPIEEAGTYQLSLLYLPDEKNASNAKITLHHADGISEKKWDMRVGDRFGFALEIGRFRFRKGEATINLIYCRRLLGTDLLDSLGVASMKCNR